MSTSINRRHWTLVFFSLFVAVVLMGCPPDPDPPDNRVTVPNVVGKTQAAAEDAITSKGLKVGAKTEKHSDTVEAGRVISQNPTAGSQVQPGSAVALTVSVGPDVVEDQTGAAVEVIVWSSAQEVKFEVEETPDEQVRENLDESVPYAGSVTLDASAAGAGKAEVVYIDARNCNMTVWVPLKSTIAAGTKLDVYLKGELPGEWILLDVKAVVEASGKRASFQTNRTGTFLVRVPDDHSVLTINYDEVEKGLWPDANYVPALGYGLHRLPAYGEACGNGHVPIILIHGVGSHQSTQEEGHSAESGKLYARWDNFVAWAVGPDGNAGTADDELDLNFYQLWLFLHDSHQPVGYDYGTQGELLPNNVRALIQEIQRQRNAGDFPGPEQQFLILAHSRGGLVTRAFVQRAGMADQVMAAITLATPHHGSPLAVPDWSFHTLAGHFSLAPPMVIIQQFAVIKNVAWWLPGYADLAWDNFDGTAPYPFGIPDRWSGLVTIFNGESQLFHHLTTNDGGWPTDSGVTDETMLLPDIYADLGGRPDGATLWNLNHDGGADGYIGKFILYAGYIADPLLKDDLLSHAGLAVLAPVMGLFESEQQAATHFAANDGMVPLQSALFLNGSHDEPIYATRRPSWFVGQDVPKEPLELLDDRITARLKVPVEHRRIFADFDHLDMVAGKGNLFSTIRQDLNGTVNSTPVADFTATVNASQVTVDASGSYDRDTELWPASGSLKYRVDWDASNGLNWTGWTTSPDLQHTYGASGTYTISLQVRDGDGMMSAVVTAEVTVTPSGGSGDEETIMLPGDVPLEMVWIEPGTFMMGRYPGEQDSYSDEDPRHQVTLSQGFWMAKYELTKRQWTAVMGTTPWSGGGYVLNDPDSPAVYVSWNDAQAFIAALNDYTGKTFRLPTEAEWEYACRAGTTTRFYWGDDPSYTAIGDYAWWDGNADNVGQDYAHVVGQKLPNAWGLYDMSGNVWEWCQDWYGDYPSGSVTDPTGPASGSNRVLRGGGWDDFGYYCRSANRGPFNPSSTNSSIGFRLSR